MNSSNTNAGGWNSSKMRTFCNGRVFDALPIEWQAMIKAVEIRATSGSQSTSIIASEDKVYLISYREVGSGSTAAGYIDEVGTSIDPVSWFTNNQQRIKFRGKIRKYAGDSTATIYSCAQEPAALYQTDIEPGTIWINTSNSSVGYIFLSQDELDHYGITPSIAADPTYALGGWQTASYWWGRSPNLGSSTAFMYVYSHGSPGNYSASNVIGVVPCFSF